MFDFQSLKAYYGTSPSLKQLESTTLLITAAANGDVDRVKELLQFPGIQIDQGDYDSRTAMHLAAGEGHVDVVIMLIEKGADVNVEDRWGGRPLDDAIRMNNAAAELLRQHGAVPGEAQTHLVEEAKKDDSRNLSRNLHAASRDLLGSGDQTIELRQIFIETLRQAYAEQVEKGELDGRGYLDNLLMGSLDQSSAEVANGKVLDDWAILSDEEPWFLYLENKLAQFHSSSSSKNGHHDYKLELNVNISLAYISAHLVAQNRFQVEFASGSTSYGEFAAAKARVLEESRQGVQKAKEYLDSLDKKKVSTVVSHMACVILLNQQAKYMEYLANSGMLKLKEARHFIEECDHALSDVKNCSLHTHPGEIEPAVQRQSLAALKMPLVEEVEGPPDEENLMETASA